MSLFTGQGPRGTFTYPNSWAPLRVGAGGWVHDIDIMSDGTMVCQTDTYGAYIWNAGGPEPGPGNGVGMWQQLVTPARMPAGDPTSDLLVIQSFSASLGVYAIRISPSATNIFYMAYMGRVFKSTNKGQTWVATGFSALTASQMPPNNTPTTASHGRKMVIDPINSNRVFLGTETAGLFKTLNGGTSWTIDSGVTASTTKGIILAYDERVSTQSGGNSQVIYAGSNGQGIWKTADGGTSWTKLNSTGMPTTMRRMIVDVNGLLYLTDDTGSQTNLWTYNGTTWTNVSFGAFTPNSGQPYHSISIDPTVANAQRIVLADLQGVLTQSINGLSGPWSGSDNGGTPNGGNASGQIATDIPYLAVIGNFSNGNQIFDSAGTLWMAEGVGVWHATPPNSSLPNGAWFWNSQSAGIEQLVTNQIVSPPGGAPIAVCWDRAIFTITDPKVYRSTYQPPSFVLAPGGCSCDWASSTPTFVIGAQTGVLNYSSDKGVTWNTKSMPGTGSGGGCIAASTTTNFVFVEAGGGSPQTTTDGGTSWTDLGSYFNTNFGIPVGTGWNAAGFYTSNDQIVCADRVNANTFYLYNENTFANGGNIYKSTTSGTTWTKQLPSSLPWGGEPGGNPMLRSVPGKAGHIFLTNGQGYSGAHPNSNNLWRSTDGGVTWTTVSNVLEPWAVGFGKQIGSYPTVFFWGWYNNSPGVYSSTDNCTTFQKIGDITTYGTFDIPKWIEGDNNVANSCYVGMFGSGFAYYGP